MKAVTVKEQKNPGLVFTADYNIEGNELEMIIRWAYLSLPIFYSQVYLPELLPSTAAIGHSANLAKSGFVKSSKAICSTCLKIS